jgi:hypothetical protein
VIQDQARLLFKGLVLTQEGKRGQGLSPFMLADSSPTAKGHELLSPIHYQVWYVRSAQKCLNMANVQEGQEARVPIDGRITGVRVNYELDSGASHCFMSEECILPTLNMHRNARVPR